MRAVLLTAPGLEHAYVATCLSDALGPQLIGLITETATASFRSAALRHNPLRLAERIVTKATRALLRHQARQERALLRVLGPRVAIDMRQYFGIWDTSKLPNPPYRRNRLEVSSVNEPAALAAIREWGATHVLVYGTGMVGKKMRDSTPLCLNMHTGISPFYRGSDAEFWPLYDRKPAMVGATVHVCTKEVDGGAIYGTEQAGLEVGDDVFTAFAKSVKVGGTLYASIVTRMANGEVLTPYEQDFSRGNAYKFVDRTFAHDLWIEARTRFGGVV